MAMEVDNILIGIVILLLLSYFILKFAIDHPILIDIDIE